MIRTPPIDALRSLSPVRARLLPHRSGHLAVEEYAVLRATQVHLLYNAIGVCGILALTVC